MGVSSQVTEAVGASRLGVDCAVAEEVAVAVALAVELQVEPSWLWHRAAAAGRSWGASSSSARARAGGSAAAPRALEGEGRMLSVPAGGGVGEVARPAVCSNAARPESNVAG